MAHAQCPSGRHEPSQTDEGIQKVDLHEAIVLFENFDAHFLLPEFLLPAVKEWHPAYSWTLTWGLSRTWPRALGLYHDGSAATKAQEAKVSAAAAAFLRVGNTWIFAGAISAPLPFATDSYAADRFASAINLKLWYDILKVHEGLGATIPDVHFCFDSLTVGSQTAGIWNCFRQPTLGAALRNVHRLIETRFGPSLYHWHVRGHVGHLGNELRLPTKPTSWNPTPHPDGLRPLTPKSLSMHPDGSGFYLMESTNNIGTNISFGFSGHGPRPLQMCSQNCSLKRLRQFEPVMIAISAYVSRLAMFFLYVGNMTNLSAASVAQRDNRCATATGGKDSHLRFPGNEA